MPTQHIGQELLVETSILLSPVVTRKLFGDWIFNSGSLFGRQLEKFKVC